MIYILFGLAVLAALVWLGRHARPLFQRGEARIFAGVTALVSFAGAAFSATREAWLPTVVLLAFGAFSAMSARTPRGVTRKSAPKKAPVDTGLAEARSILGVAPGASSEEIQAAYVRLIRMAHPDRGGTSGLAAQLNAARDRLLRG